MHLHDHTVSPSRKVTIPQLHIGTKGISGTTESENTAKVTGKGLSIV